ncbi:MAG TPA: hypothetical protein VFG50_02165 [Rhodothermales bacterium]|nr:hypothetical protein [Rhodothermales bacterium]
MNRRGVLLRVAAGLLLLWLGGTAAPALGQIVRPPELNMQLHRAETAWRSGTSLLEAKARVDRVLTALPDDVEARKLRAEVLLAMNRPADAVRDAQRAVELDSSDGEARIILSEAARLSGNRELALKALDAAAERIVDDGPLHLRLSWNAMELGELGKAEAFARIALALQPDAPAAYQQLARVFLLENKDTDAAEILARGLRMAVVPFDVIRNDTLLSRVLSNPLLSPYARK